MVKPATHSKSPESNVKTNSSPPFGSKVKRFHKIFLHPGLDRQGVFTTKPLGCDPCRYSPQSMEHAFEVNKYQEIIPWMYKKALEEWAKNLGYRNQKILDYKAQRRAALGPAWHTVEDPPKNRSLCKDVGFGTVRRFKTFPSTTAGPGRYYTARPFRALPGPHTAVPSFEWSPACRFPDTALAWSQAPDRYRIVDRNSIDQKSNKIVSKRGPYDLFTGKRDGTTIRNLFSDNLKCSAATWPIALKGSFERFKKTRLGVMNKTGRAQRPSGRNVLTDTAMCYRDPKDPGPASYSVMQPCGFKQYIHGFNSSSTRAQRGLGVWPSVGRYSFVKPHHIPGHGHGHVFASTVPRTIGAVLPQPMNAF